MLKRDELFGLGFTRKFTFSGTEYDCIRSAIDRTNGEYPEAIAEQTETAIRIWNADFDTLPARGDIVTMNSTDYRVLDIHTDPFEETSKLALGNRYHAGR